MSNSNTTPDATPSGLGMIVGRLVNWGLPKQRPKSLEEANNMARPMIRRWVIAAVSVSWVPGSTLLLGTMDYKLFHDIAKIYQIPDFDVDAMFVAIGGSVVGRGTAEAAGWAFGVGWLTNPFIAGFITKTLADAIVNHMQQESPLPRK